MKNLIFLFCLTLAFATQAQVPIDYGLGTTSIYQANDYGTPDMFPSHQLINTGSHVDVFTVNQSGTPDMFPSHKLVNSGTTTNVYNVNSSGTTDLLPSAVILHSTQSIQPFSAATPYVDLPVDPGWLFD